MVDTDQGRVQPFIRVNGRNMCALDQINDAGKFRVSQMTHDALKV